jgi:type I restriction enzyme, S subunit
VSPSSAGTITERVLTLSAITGTSFDATCVKEGTFETIAPPEKRVSSSDFLICRGNGNLNLVGKGFFATASGNTIFPDTMIAARFSRELFEPAFIETLWNSQYVRSQLEPRARTTNGTFKINQGALEGIRFPVPPVDLQHAFAARVAEIDKLKAHHRAHLAKLDALFASLQHRGFRGEL